jgi:hypothetical protein
MSAANKALARSFFQEADRGRTPVELCSPDFTAYFPGSPPMDLEGFDQFEAMIRSAFSNIEHPIEDLVGVGDDVAIRLRFEGTTRATLWVFPPAASISLSKGRRSSALSGARSPASGASSTNWA